MHRIYSEIWNTSASEPSVHHVLIYILACKYVAIIIDMISACFGLFAIYGIYLYMLLASCARLWYLQFIDSFCWKLHSLDTILSHISQVKISQLQIQCSHVLYSKKLPNKDCIEVWQKKIWWIEVYLHRECHGIN